MRSSAHKHDQGQAAVGKVGFTPIKLHPGWRKQLRLHPSVWIFAAAVMLTSWFLFAEGGFDWRNDIGPYGCSLTYIKEWPRHMISVVLRIKHLPAHIYVPGNLIKPTMRIFCNGEYTGRLWLRKKEHIPNQENAIT